MLNHGWKTMGQPITMTAKPTAANLCTMIGQRAGNSFKHFLDIGIQLGSPAAAFP